MKARIISIIVFILMLNLISACGPSPLRSALQGGAISEDSVEIWNRSPTADGEDLRLTAADDLNSIVPKSWIQLRMLTDWARSLSNNYFEVQHSLDDEQLPNAAKWKSKSVPWGDKDFQALMAYSAATESIKYMSKVFPDIDLFKSTNLSGQNIAPFVVESSACCNALQTGYDPQNRVLSFFQHNKNPLPRFNMVDERDVVHHEMGHILQHAVNPVPLESYYGDNPDVDFLLEGLSDFYAASVLLDQNIFTYTSANIRALLSRFNRSGQEHKRGLGHKLKFPDAYIQDSHLDGRVVAGALWDIVEHLQDRYKLSAEDAAAAILRLSMTGYRLMSSSSTLHGYTSLVLEEVNPSWAKDICDKGSCANALKGEIEELLVKRGIRSHELDQQHLPSRNIHFSAESALGFMEYPSYSSFSNENNVVDPCEVLLIYPNIKNISISGSASAYEFMDNLVRLDNIEGFSPVLHPQDSRPLDVLASGERSLKWLPWLSPQESSLELINNLDSRLYRSQFGSSFSRPLSTTYFPSEFGWLVRAPASGTGRADFTVQLRTYNAPTLKYRNFTISTSLTVTGNQSFCN